jgi:hypothetical protein
VKPLPVLVPVLATVVTSLAMLLAACTSDDASSSTSTDAGDAAVAPTDGGGSSSSSSSSGDSGPTVNDGGACNTLVNAAPESTIETVKGNAPAATGGTITDGTYFQTKFVIYDPTSNASPPEPGGLKATLKITGKTMDLVLDLGDGENKTFTESFTTNGTAVDRVLSCPKVGDDLKAVYSVAGNELVLFETDPNTKTVAGSTFVKQ